MRRTSSRSVNLSMTYQGRRAPTNESDVGRTSPARMAVEFSFRTPAWRMIRVRTVVGIAMDRTRSRRRLPGPTGGNWL